MTARKDHKSPIKSISCHKTIKSETGPWNGYSRPWKGDARPQYVAKIVQGHICMAVKRPGHFELTTFCLLWSNFHSQTFFVSFVTFTNIFVPFRKFFVRFGTWRLGTEEVLTIVQSFEFFAWKSKYTMWTQSQTIFSNLNKNVSEKGRKWGLLFGQVW